jgi:hypothetical protein
MGDMAISAHTRKILWSFSGHACARCGTQLGSSDRRVAKRKFFA